MELYGFEITMRGEGNLPDWLGSSIRGALGSGLIKRCCVRDTPDCGKCPDFFRCSAKTFFYTAPPDCAQLAANPYVIRNYSYDGELLSFELLLFGKGKDCAGEVLRTLSAGLRIGKDRHLFALETVRCIFTGNYVFDGTVWIEPQLYKLPGKKLSAGSIKIELLTPWISKSREKPSGFDYFIRACTRRATAVLDCCGENADFDIMDIFAKAAHVETVGSELSEKAVSRYSSRTDSRTTLSGCTGTLIFSGDMEPFSEVISLCEYSGVGKMCVMGLGQFTVTQL